jgi:hypothetical protein
MHQGETVNAFGLLGEKTQEMDHERGKLKALTLSSWVLRADQPPGGTNTGEWQGNESVFGELSPGGRVAKSPLEKRSIYKEDNIEYMINKVIRQQEVGWA